MRLRLSRTARLYTLAAAFYALMGFLLLHGLIFTNGTHGGSFDWFNYNWNFWWIRHALSYGLNIYINDMVMAPHTVSFAYHALTAFWFPVWAVLEPLVGTLTAMNAILFLMAFLNGYVLFILLMREGASPALALTGGLLLQASPVTRYFYYNTHINLGDWFWLPANVLLWGQIVRAAEQGRPGRTLLWAVIHGAALWGVGHTDLQFPIFVGFWLVPYGLWTLWKSPRRLWLIGAGAVVVAVTGVLLWLAGPLPYMAQFRGELAPGPVEVRPGIPFPRGYLSTDPVWWWWNVPTLGGNVLILLVITLAGWWVYRRQRSMEVRPSWSPPRWFWMLVLIPPFILSMGPQINLFGVEIPMPFRLLYAITDGMFKMPWRLAPIYVAAGAVFAALSWTAFWRLRPPHPNRRMLGLAAVVLLFGADVRLYQTPPVGGTALQPVLPAYDFYSAIGRETSDPYDRMVILDVPTAAGTGEVLIGLERAIQYQFYGMTHHKRTLNGFISRAPVDFFWGIRTDNPLLAWLGQRREYDPDLALPELRRIIDAWPVGYVVVHQDDLGRNTPTPQEILGIFNSVDDLLCPVWIERDVVVYRTAWHPDGCPPRTPPEIEPGVYVVELGESGDERFIGLGWHWPEEVGGLRWRWGGEYPDARLYVDLPPGNYTVTLAAQAFWEARRINVLVNGVPLAPEPQTATPDRLGEFTFRLPADVVGEGQHLEVALSYDAVIVPAEVGQSADPRRLAVAVDRVVFRREG